MIKHRLPWVLILSLLTGCIASAQATASPRARAATAISAGRFNQALYILEPELKLHPRDPVLLTLEGLARSGLHQTASSLASFDRALAIDPSLVPALQGAAQTAYSQADPRAFTYVKKLLEVQPRSDVANGMAGVLAWQGNDCASSVRYFEQSHDEVYRDPKAIDQYSDCLLKQQRPDDALRLLTTALERFPDRRDLKYNLAIAQLKTHQPSAAVVTLEPIQNEQDVGLLNLLAAAYMQTDRPDDAFRVLERAIEIKPADPTNYLDLSILCLEHNQEERSIKAATAGISHAGKTASLYLIRGVAYAQLAQYENAENDFQTAAEIEPNQPHSTIAMSMLYSDRNQLDKERALLTAQLQKTPHDPVANYLLADLMIRSGVHPGQPDFSAAEQHLATSLQVRPDSAEAQILMGHLLEEEGDIPGALTHYTSALQLQPNDRSALDRQFLLLRKLHRNEEAAKVLVHLKFVLNEELAHESAASHPTSPSVTPQ